MNSLRRKFSLAVVVLFLGVLACNYFVSPTPIVIVVTSTPDFTMTAIIDLLQISQQTAAALAPTSTSDAGQGAAIQAVASDTPTPTETPTLTSTPIPTNTPVPTITLTPTVSYAGPVMRPGTSIAAAYVADSPNLDGELSDWDAAIYPASYPVYGAGKISEEIDLSANVMVTWDESYLYVGARVKDDQYHQNATGKYLFRGDSVEILLDTRVGADYYLNVLSDDDYQLGVSPGNPSKGNNPEAYLWYPAGVAGPRSNVSIGVMGTANGYHIELAIPWGLFGVNPYAGQHFGFAFSVSDNDTGSENVQQSMISNVPTRYLPQPMTWGDLTLTQ